jgi:lipoate-protein ligase A
VKDEGTYADERRSPRMSADGKGIGAHRGASLPDGRYLRPSADIRVHPRTSSFAWRYLDSGPLSGAENMALDEAMLAAHAAGEAPPTLRVYGWQPPAISLGKFQQAERSVNLEACRRLGIEVVRRPTGGRAILHTGDEVTFSLVVSAAALGTTGVMDSYRRLAAGIVRALRLLGLEARLVERAAPGRAPAAMDPACFAVKARCDLVVGDAKLVGSAQVQRRGFVLQQNSLPLRLRAEEWSQVFRRAAAPPEAVGLWEAAGREIAYQEVAAALRRGFAEGLGVAMENGHPTKGERERAKALAEEASLLAAPIGGTTR